MTLAEFTRIGIERARLIDAVEIEHGLVGGGNEEARLCTRKLLSLILRTITEGILLEQDAEKKASRNGRK